jgi:membrane protease YdiL (CAAX protease family)
MGFNTPPLGAVKTGGAGDLFPRIRKDFKEKSSIPRRSAAGIIYSYFIGMGFGMIILLILSFVFYRIENNPWKWNCFCNRYRIKRMKKNDWIIFLIVFFISMVINLFVFPLFDKFIIRNGLIPIPKSVPDWLNPSVTDNSEKLFDQAVGGLKGNWTAIFVFLIGLIFNIIGEELWWRGYILPRQELSFGKKTWIIHGFLWPFFHIFKYWDIPTLIILHLPFSYMVCRTKNTTTGILLHFIMNGIQIIFLIKMVI